MQQIQQSVLYQYQKSEITFSPRSNSGLMVNATQISRVFRKQQDNITIGYDLISKNGYQAFSIRSKYCHQAVAESMHHYQ